MSGRVGGTIEQMTMMGTQFSNEADTLSALVGRITSQLNSTDWEGGAAQRFRDRLEHQAGHSSADGDT